MLKESLIIRLITDLRETTMNGGLITVRFGMSGMGVITLMATVLTGRAMIIVREAITDLIGTIA